MKKLLTLAIVLCLLVSLMSTACAEEKTKIVIGATPSPHQEILEQIVDDMAALGYDLEIITFTENAMKEDEEKEEGKGRRASKYDELLPDAVNLVMSTGQASASSIQRRFRVGYTRAARLIDEMEDLSIVGPNIGSKPREILMNSEQAAAVLAECSDS